MACATGKAAADNYGGNQRPAALPVWDAPHDAKSEATPAKALITAVKAAGDLNP